MKIIKTGAILALIVGSLAANAYKCISPNQSQTIEVISEVTKEGDTTVEVYSHESDEKQTYYGFIETEGALFKLNTIHFTNANGSLEIFTAPTMCGRGSCPPGGGSTVTAVLKIKNLTSNFFCDETFL